MSHYRTHTSGELRIDHVGMKIKLSGWVHRKRDHGGLLFIDIRDHYGITQCIIHPDYPNFQKVEHIRNETIVTIEGLVVQRDLSTVNLKMKTGEIEVVVDNIAVLCEAPDLPLPINSDVPYNEEIRLRYRYLDLRRSKMHQNIVMRSKIIQSMRKRMLDMGFLELQTPILTASSPEGARDFLVPSRHSPGKFYALPQAPQQFKQLYMMGGFDKYFQIAPCFRDEDARADRSPGEFYQLDLEMSFVTQEEVFKVVETVLQGTFEEFAENKSVTKGPFPRITYQEAIEKYGSDKPDLRNPLIIQDVTKQFENSEFSVFAKAIEERGHKVLAIPVNGIGEKPRSFYDGLNHFAHEQGMAGLGYITLQNGLAKGPLSKYLNLDNLKDIADIQNSAVFFICDHPKKAYGFGGSIRAHLGKQLELIEKNVYKFCWITDFPMFEYDELRNKIDFSHNPFSMPQGGLEALNTRDPLEIKAYQYDIVCNGYELSSGAIRNHDPAIMYKAFEIAGYTQEEVDTRFGGLINALKFGAPPHGGSAPGIDRIVMLLLGEENLREIVAFPMNQQAQDLMLGSPSSVSPTHLKELGLSILKK